MEHDHRYALTLEWTGNQGTGTDGYRTYKRDHVIRIEGKPELLGSSDPTFRGDASRHNPEDMLVAALSACHLLSYLHACVTEGVIVTSYVDHATGLMQTSGNSGRFAKTSSPRAKNAVLPLSTHNRATACANHVFPLPDGPRTTIAGRSAASERR